jgi:Tol biopolymer transport system component
VAGLVAGGLPALLATCTNDDASTDSPSAGASSGSMGGTIESPDLPRALADLPIARDLPGRIVYNTIEGDLWIVNGDGSGRRRLTDSGGGIDYSPTWAPTGSQIAFRTTRGDAADSIFIIDSDGENERQLSPPGVDAIFPAWSPDGRLIAYTAAELTVVQPDGRGERSLGTDGECANWSPDGTTIAYCSNSINRGEGVDNWDVFVIDRNGSGRTRLTASPSYD